jgi:RHS repeat-associated protein
VNALTRNSSRSHHSKFSGRLLHRGHRRSEVSNRRFGGLSLIFVITAALIAQLALVLVPASPAAATTPTGPGILGPGAALSNNESITSPNGQFRLVMQGDGNLVEYDGTTVAWASGTSGSGYDVVMQGDGNLVIYSATNVAEWASNTSVSTGAYLDLNNEGVLSVDSSTGTILWGAAGVLIPGASLSANQSITSPNGQFRLVMQGDGNLVESDGTRVEWASGTSGSGLHVIMQGDGNLVIYSATNVVEWASNTSVNSGAYLDLSDQGLLSVDAGGGTILWGAASVLIPGASLSANQSITSPNGQFRLVMQGDGNLVESDGSATAWASGTSGSGYHAVMQGDGNLVIYSATNVAEWASNTSVNTGAYLDLNDQGVLSVDSAGGTILWGAASVLIPGATLSANQSITSPNGQFRLVMQGDGNLVESQGSTVEWASGTSGSGCRVIAQGDGNLVIYNSSNVAEWASNTSGNAGAYLDLNDEGVLSVDSAGGGVLWEPEPVVTGISPESGSTTGGTTVTITGSGLASATVVNFGTTSATIQSDTPNSVTVVSPSGTGVDDVTVQTASGTSKTSSADQFTYSSAPIVSAVGPTSGSTGGGTTVTISGSGFTGTTAVKFGANAGTSIDVISDSQLTVVDPAGSAGSVDVTVTTPLGTSPISASDHFTYGQSLASCTDSWTGALNSDWGTAGNWSQNAIPGSSSIACIPNGEPNLPVQLSETTSISGMDNIGGLIVSGALGITGTSSSISSGPLYLNGGVISGPGTLTIAASSTVDVDGSSTEQTFEGGIRVVNDGQFTLDPGEYLYLGDADVLENAGTITLGNGSDIEASGQVDGSAAVNNLINDAGGTISTPASDSSTISMYDFANYGVFSTAGVLDLNGTTTLYGTQSLTGSGTVNFEGLIQVPTSATINGVFNLDGGTIDGPGTLTVPEDSSMVLDGSSTEQTFEGGIRVVIDGQLTLETGEILFLGNADVLENAGAITLNNGADITADGQNDGSTAVDNFVNDASGTISTPTSGTSTIDMYDFANYGVFSTSGVLDLDGTTTLYGTQSFIGSGTVQLEGLLQVPTSATIQGNVNLDGGTISGPGTLNIPASSSMSVDGTPRDETLEGGITIVNDGQFTLEPGQTLYVDDADVLENFGALTLDNGSVVESDGNYDGVAVPDNLINELNGTITTPSNDSVTISMYDFANYGVFSTSGVLDLNGTTTLYGTQNFNGAGTVDLDGVIQVPTSATIQGNVNLDGGNFSGPGTLNIPSSSSISVDGTPRAETLEGGITIVNDGQLTLDPGETLYVGDADVLENAGTLTLDNGSTIESSDAFDGSPVIGNLINEADGTISTPSNDSVTISMSNFVNYGVFSTTGVLNLVGALTFTGVQSFIGTGIVNLSAEIQVPTAATIDGTINIDSGSVYGTGTLTISPSSNITVFGWLLEGGIHLVNQGQMTLAANETLSVDNADVLENAGTLNLENGSVIESDNEYDGPTATANLINDVGDTVFTPASASTTISMDNFADNGIISTSGTLNLDGTTTLSPSSDLSGGGTVGDNGTLITPVGAGANVSSTLNGDGQIEVASAGDFGWLQVDNASIGDLSFYVADPGAVCGESAIALRGSGISGSWSTVEGDSNPSEWIATASATQAGAYNNCPVPQEPTAETYGIGSSEDAENVSNYQAEPVNTSTGAYSTTESDGKLAGLGIPFTFTRAYTSDDTYSGPLGPGWTDSLNVFLTPGSNTETLSDEDGQQTVFTSLGGNAYEGPPGSLSTLSAESGGGWLLVRHDQSQLLFNENGQLISEVDRNGIGLSLDYNGSGELATVTDYAGRTVTFSYNGSGHLTKMDLPLSRTVTYTYNGSGELSSVTDAAGGVTSYTYSSAGLLSTITDQNGHQVVANTYDGSGRVISQVNALGKTATFSYSAGDTTYTDPNGQKWQDMYDGNVLIEQINPLGGATTFGYDSNLNVISTTDPNGNTTSSTYDDEANLLSETTPLGETTRYTYDSLNDETSMTDPLGNETAFTYNSVGDLLSTTDPDGDTTTYVRDPTTGVVTSSTDPNGHTTTYAYNAAGELTSTTDPLGNATTYTYDAAGRKTSSTNALGETTNYAYDALDRMTSVTNPDDDTTNYTYDAVGNRLSSETPNGHTTSYAYDADNRLTSVTAPGGATTTYTYDNNGNKTSMTDGDGHTTTYAYGADNRIISSTDALGNSTTYTYDAAGNELTKTDALGVVMTDAYDGDNQLTSVSYSDGTPSVSYVYDADGQRTSMTDGTGTTTYTYDPDGNVLTRATPSGTFTYTYDSDGNELTREYPDGSTVTSTYDSDDRLASVNANGGTTTYTYDAASQLTSATLPNGVIETTTYDPAGFVASIVDKKGSDVVTSRTYSYDADGNPTTIVTQSETDTYTYDAQDRLTAACYGSSCADGHFVYTYDAVGNRTQEVSNGSTTTYSYNAANQLTTSVTDSATTTYTYDADGRRVKAVSPSGTTTDAWNAAGELTGTTTPSSTTTYAYDGDGNRANSTSAGVTTTFVYDTNGQLPQLVEELNGATEVRSYVWGERLLSMNSGGDTYYVAHDALGSDIGLTSSTGATDETFTYDPFGNALSTTNFVSGTPSIPLRFDAGYLDSTGLYDFGARQLDPTTGTFLSTDPLGENLAEPSISPYVYVGDMPTVMVDPSGMKFSWGRLAKDIGEGAAVIGVAAIVATAIVGTGGAAAVLLTGSAFIATGLSGGAALIGAGQTCNSSGWGSNSCGSAVFRANTGTAIGVAGGLLPSTGSLVGDLAVDGLYSYASGYAQSGLERLYGSSAGFTLSSTKCDI